MSKCAVLWSSSGMSSPKPQAGAAAAAIGTSELAMRCVFMSAPRARARRACKATLGDEPHLLPLGAGRGAGLLVDVIVVDRRRAVGRRAGVAARVVEHRQRAVGVAPPVHRVAVEDHA